MKKLMVLLLALMLTGASAHAQTAFSAVCDGVTVLNVHYDETALRLDTESYLGSSRGNHTWLGIFYNNAHTIELSADRYDDLPADSDLNQLALYLCSILSAYQCSVVETWSGPLPFVILSLNGPLGQSYYAAALSQGYVVHFEIYHPRGEADDSCLSALKTLLAGVSR